MVSNRIKTHAVLSVYVYMADGAKISMYFLLNRSETVSAFKQHLCY